MNRKWYVLRSKPNKAFLFAPDETTTNMVHYSSRKRVLLEEMQGSGLRTVRRCRRSIVPRLPLFRFSLTHDYDMLPFVRQKILDAVL